MELPQVHFSREFDELLGTGKGRTRSCWNKTAHAHGDKTPSLSFDPKTGAWTCFSCREKGDLFTLYHRLKGWSFRATLDHLAARYGFSTGRPKVGSSTSKFKVCQAESELTKWLAAKREWKSHPEHVEFMRVRYGLTLATIERYQLGLDLASSRRLLIPVFAQEVGGPVVNLRKHDTFRACCEWHNTKSDIAQPGRPSDVDFKMLAAQDYGDWEPKWVKQGKVTSVKDHGGPYLYPIHVLDESPRVYLVGGELKALLLNQLGAPAVAFTGGEGQYSAELLSLLVGKSVRVLFDVDKTGVDATFGRAPGTDGPEDKGVQGLAQVLADAGVSVEAGRWPADIVAELPKKGDVTDYLARCSWNISALDLIQWTSVLRRPAEYVEDEEARGDDPAWEDHQPIVFSGLVDPANVGRWTKFPGLVSGRGEAPFIVPHACTFTCPAGQASVRNHCKECVLPGQKFEAKLTYTTKQQVELVGLPQSEIETKTKRAVGIPPRCPYPKLDARLSSVEQLVLTPAVDVQEGGDFEYAHRTAYLISDFRIDLRENTTYEFGGLLLPDPKNSRFTAGLKKFRPAEGDIFHFRPDADKELALKKVVERGVGPLVADLRDHVCHIYGQDEMLLAILLSMVLPFQFRLGDQDNERICPAVLVVGDTTVGKSTVTKSFVRHFGAGRFRTMDSRPTFAGLIGGNIPWGNRMAFSWGLLPTSHRAFVGLDEFAKLPIEDIGALTNTLSSGVAERITANGNRRTKCHVRLLYLTNPRGTASLKSLDSFEAALKVMGTVQDLGRVEYLHVQHELKDKSLFARRQHAESPHRYTHELARYHLSWAWNLTKEKITFEDADHLLTSASTLSERFGSNTLLLPAMARFKLARFAAAFAILLFSHDGWNLVVTKEHVGMAMDFFERNYSKFLRASSTSTHLPQQIQNFLSSLKAGHRLRVLAQADKFTKDDIKDCLDHMPAAEFIRLFQMEHAMIARTGPYYRFKEERHKELLMEYLNAS